MHLKICSFYDFLTQKGFLPLVCRLTEYTIQDATACKKILLANKITVGKV